MCLANLTDAGMRMKRIITLMGKSGEKGQALVELAIVLPLIVLLLFGIVDYSRAIHAKSVIAQMSREAANLVARPNTGLTGDEPTDFQNAMYFVAKDAGQLNMVTQGKMYITKAEYISGDNRITTKVPWNQGDNNLASSLPALNRPVTNEQLGNIDLQQAKVAYVVEVIYRYRSIFPSNPLNFSPTFTLYSVSIF
jgi:Flp pilus assembly protein TadG